MLTPAALLVLSIVVGFGFYYLNTQLQRIGDILQDRNHSKPVPENIRPIKFEQISKSKDTVKVKYILSNNQEGSYYSVWVQESQNGLFGRFEIKRRPNNQSIQTEFIAIFSGDPNQLIETDIPVTLDFENDGSDDTTVRIPG